VHCLEDARPRIASRRLHDKIIAGRQNPNVRRIDVWQMKTNDEVAPFFDQPSFGFHQDFPLRFEPIVDIECPGSPAAQKFFVRLLGDVVIDVLDFVQDRRAQLNWNCAHASRLARFYYEFFKAL